MVFGEYLQTSLLYWNNSIFILFCLFFCCQFIAFICLFIYLINLRFLKFSFACLTLKRTRSKEEEEEEEVEGKEEEEEEGKEEEGEEEEEKKEEEEEEVEEEEEEEEVKEDGEEVEVCVSHVESPDLFYLQLISMEEK